MREQVKAQTTARTSAICTAAENWHALEVVSRLESCPRNETSIALERPSNSSHITSPSKVKGQRLRHLHFHSLTLIISSSTVNSGRVTCTDGGRGGPVNAQASGRVLPREGKWEKKYKCVYRPVDSKNKKREEMGKTV